MTEENLKNIILDKKQGDKDKFFKNLEIKRAT